MFGLTAKGREVHKLKKTLAKALYLRKQTGRMRDELSEVILVLKEKLKELGYE